MPSGRGVLVFASGILMWVGARMLGSPTLHMVAVGLVLLPFAAALFARWSKQRVRIRRRLSEGVDRPCPNQDEDEQFESFHERLQRSNSIRAVPRNARDPRVARSSSISIRTG